MVFNVLFCVSLCVCMFSIAYTLCVCVCVCRGITTVSVSVNMCDFLGVCMWVLEGTLDCVALYSCASVGVHLCVLQCKLFVHLYTHIFLSVRVSVWDCILGRIFVYVCFLVLVSGCVDCSVHLSVSPCAYECLWMCVLGRCSVTCACRLCMSELPSVCTWGVMLHSLACLWVYIYCMFLSMFAHPWGCANFAQVSWACLYFLDAHLCECAWMSTGCKSVCMRCKHSWEIPQKISLNL